MIGWDGHKMSKSRGNLVLVSRLREQGVDPAAIRLGLLAGHYRSDRSWSDAGARRGQRPVAPVAGRRRTARRPGRRRRRRAAARSTSPTTSTPPKRLPPLMVGVTDALEYGGHDVAAPPAVAAAVDALLGVPL